MSESGAAAKYVEYRCGTCKGQWVSAIKPEHGPLRPVHPCVYCRDVAMVHTLHNDMPTPDFEALAQREFEDRRTPERRAAEQAARSRCPFCDTTLVKGKNESREHILARWLRSAPPLVESLATQRVGARRWIQDEPQFVPMGVIIPPPRMLESKNTHALYATVAVCMACNSGWMSALENEAKPILHPLVNGETDHISPTDAKILMRWAAKVMVAYERDDPATAAATPAQIRDVRLGRTPRWAELWVARNANPAETILRHTEFQVRASSHQILVAFGSRTYIGLGHIVLRLHAMNGPQVDLNVVSPGRPWLRVWPTGHEDVALPPDPVSAAEIRSTDNGVTPVQLRPRPE